MNRQAICPSKERGPNWQASAKNTILSCVLTLVLAFIYLAISTSTVHADTLTVTISASNSVVVQGGSSTLSVSGVPSGGSYTYQWFEGPSGALTPVTGATSSTYTFSTSSSTTLGVYGFGVVVTDASGTQSYSPELDIPVVAASASSAVVFAEPDAGNIIQVDGLGSGSYQYQWYEQAPGGSRTAISGATSDSLSFAVPDGTAIGEWSFQVEITDSSNVLAAPQTSVVVASLTVSNSVIVQGGSTILTILGVPNDGSYTFQWYAGPSNELTPVSGATSNTYTFTTDTSTTLGTYGFGVIVTSSSTETQVNAPELNIQVIAAPTATDTASISGGSVTIDQSGTTGASITIKQPRCPRRYIHHSYFNLLSANLAAGFRRFAIRRHRILRC